MRFSPLIMLILLLCAWPSPGFSTEKDVYEGSGLPIPRFVSLRSDRVFVRTGPALRYPVRWVFQKEALPVEIIQEFDAWRKIRDAEGDEGWVHQSLLTGSRTVLIQAPEMIDMRREDNESARLSARIEPRVVASLERCTPEWCEVEAEGYRGWVKRNYLWGIYAGEDLD